MVFTRALPSRKCGSFSSSSEAELDQVQPLSATAPHKSRQANKRSTDGIMQRELKNAKRRFNASFASATPTNLSIGKMKVRPNVAKRLECVKLASAFGIQSGSKLHALQTLPKEVRVDVLARLRRFGPIHKAGPAGKQSQRVESPHAFGSPSPRAAKGFFATASASGCRGVLRRPSTKYTQPITKWRLTPIARPITSNHPNPYPSTTPNNH